MKFNYSFVLIMVLCLIVNVQHAQGFKLQECLNSEYSAEVKHKVGPFGLLEVFLKVQKKNCVIKIEHKKFYSQNYEIDVCRSPIHIKKGSGGVDVIKRVDCTDFKNTSDFCDHLRMLEGILQDDGLIFALGEKEILTTEHGKVFCAFSLIQTYLREGDVLSRFPDEDRVQGTFDGLSPQLEASPTVMPSPTPVLDHP